MANTDYAETANKVPTKKLLARVSDIAVDVGTLRDRIYSLQSRIDGAEPLATVTPIAGNGLKAMVDRLEGDLRAISRTMTTLEDLL